MSNLPVAIAFSALAISFACGEVPPGDCPTGRVYRLDLVEVRRDGVALPTTDPEVQRWRTSAEAILPFDGPVGLLEEDGEVVELWIKRDGRRE